MLKTKAKSAATTLDRLLGEKAEIQACEPVFINRFIRAEFLQVITPQHPLPEESGRLFLYPVDDGQYALHLLYSLDEDASYTEVCWIQFLPSFFNLFEEKLLSENTPFRFDRSTELQFPVCGQNRGLIEQLRQLAALTPLLRSLHLTETSIQLLRRAIENVTVPFAACPVPACRFLAHESEREKIAEARRIMDQTYDKPLTIKDLARKVAINECYLKKGFKTLVGKTINEYQQHLRITKARELLQQQGQSVSEVASALGYSSISHFSTAFKKATGMKPCELLG